MPQRRHRGLLHVIGNQKVTSVPGGVGLRNDEQTRRSARRSTKRDSRPLAGAPHHSQKIVKDGRLDLHCANLPPSGSQQRELNRLNAHLLEVSCLDARMMPFQNRALIGQRWIANLDLDEKAVELRLRQW